jgi:hypothetical protein
MPRATNEKRRQHTTYCCLPLANNTRMNGSTEMAENREANYLDASLGWVSWPKITARAETRLRLMAKTEEMPGLSLLRKGEWIHW